MEKVLTKDSTKTEILENLYSVEINDWQVEDQIYIEDLDTTAIKYTHVNGYFYSDSFNDFWVEDAHEFESDEDYNWIGMKDPIWLKSK